MNQTEKLAFEWLQEQGAKDITFRRTRSPDFIADIGQFEVKKIEGKKQVFFTEKQAKTFSKYPTIKYLLFQENQKTPIVLNYNELLANYNISVVKFISHKKQWKKAIKMPVINVKERTFEEFKRLKVQLQVEANKDFTDDEAMQRLLSKLVEIEEA